MQLFRTLLKIYGASGKISNQVASVEEADQISETRERSFQAIERLLGMLPLRRLRFEPVVVPPDGKIYFAHQRGSAGAAPEEKKEKDR